MFVQHLQQANLVFNFDSKVVNKSQAKRRSYCFIMVVMKTSSLAGVKISPSSSTASKTESNPKRIGYCSLFLQYSGGYFPLPEHLMVDLIIMQRPNDVLQ
ncbi:hypothetical protein NE237_001156 [Protea cynaroides]|uniref:Uncharacterized protein n=1 Tax=Protea cynaroides TaxID=273540 RepID=A0A9Q0QY75_9MAGN|nr:hypothetical protein NE237_001156 [Protea cynaroides]